MTQSTTSRGFGGHRSGRPSRIIAMLAVLAIGAVVLAAIRPAWMYVKAAQVLIAFDTSAQRASAAKVVERELTVEPTVLARLYTPKGDLPREGIVLVHGMHPMGMNEPRLVALARALTQAGLAVLTPQVPALLHFELSTKSIAAIEQAANRLAKHLHARTVGVFGISFSGALALIAASRAPAHTHIGFVVSLGAHHDLLRFASFALGNPVTGPSKQRSMTPPHPYAAAIIAYNVAQDLFPPEDVPKAKEALLALLQSDKNRSTRAAETLSSIGRAIFDRLQDHRFNARSLKPVHDAVRRQSSRLRQLSPQGLLHRVSLPVVLLHGHDDPIVPWTEVMWLAEELPRHRIALLLVSPLIRHAELKESATWSERIKLLHAVFIILSLAAT